VDHDSAGTFAAKRCYGGEEGAFALAGRTVLDLEVRRFSFEDRNDRVRNRLRSRVVVRPVSLKKVRPDP
jgi:hypothetical protein